MTAIAKDHGLLGSLPQIAEQKNKMSASPLISRRLFNSTKHLQRECVGIFACRSHATNSSLAAQLTASRRGTASRGASHAVAPSTGILPQVCVASSHRSDSSAYAWLAGATAASVLVVHVANNDGESHAITRCESSSTSPQVSAANDNEHGKNNHFTDDNSHEKDSDLPPNPLWPSGVPQEMVDKFVDEILADPNINIASIPDSIEREIYVNTVLLTLNIVYETVGSFHGMDMFGHVIELHRVDEDDDEKHIGASHETSAVGPEKTMKQRVRRAYSRNAYGPGSIDHAALEAVADRLLANKAVNQPLIPDVVERQLYINCLQLVFRLLDAIASTLRITMCGHDIRVMFEPCSDQSTRDLIKERLQKRAGDASSKLTLVDLAAVEKYARQVGAAPEDRNQLNLLGKVFDRGQREMEVQLNKTLYALILGIVDDLLEDTVFQFLSDRIRMDVVARRSMSKGKVGGCEREVEKGTGTGTGIGGQKVNDNADAAAKTKVQTRSSGVPVGAFAFGVAVGAGVVSVLTAAGRR